MFPGSSAANWSQAIFLGQFSSVICYAAGFEEVTMQPQLLKKKQCLQQKESAQLII